MVSFACSEVAQVSRASGAVFAFLVSDVLVLQRFQFQLGKSNDFLSTAVNRTLFIEGADAKKKEQPGRLTRSRPNDDPSPKQARWAQE